MKWEKLLLKDGADRTQILRQPPNMSSGVDPSAILGGGMSEARRAEKSRPEGPRAEVGFLGRGQPAPPHQLGGLGEHCKLPQWGPGRSPGRQTILPHLPGQDGLSWRLMVLILLVLGCQFC